MTVPTRSATGTSSAGSSGPRCTIRSSSASSRASTSSVSLRPPGRKNLMPLSGNGLCDAEITAPHTSSQAEALATAGVGATPRRSTSTPSEASPAASAASSIGPDRLVSRPITNLGPPSTRAAARPSAVTSSGVSSAFASPRTPSVPNRRVMGTLSGQRSAEPSSPRAACAGPPPPVDRLAGRPAASWPAAGGRPCSLPNLRFGSDITALNTEELCGPSSGRTSWAPSRGGRGSGSPTS